MAMQPTGVQRSLDRPGWLGVIGGMGPLATADFLAKLALATPASSDQEQVPVLVYGDCGTPDRTDAALARGPSPLPRLLDAVDFLSSQGAQLIAMPCNSAHAWYADLAMRSTCPVLNIVDACIQRIRRRCAGARRIGILSTEGTARQGIYTRRLEEQGFEAIVPTGLEFAHWISPGIARVKANAPDAARGLLEAAAEQLLLRGADVVVLGCTEIPVALQSKLRTAADLYIDSTQALVEAVLLELRGTAALALRPPRTLPWA